MTFVESTILLPPNVIEVYLTDVDLDGEDDIVVAAKSIGSSVPAPIDLFVYQYNGSVWMKTKHIPLGQKAIFWEADAGLWGVDSKGVLNLWTGERVLEQSTWLNGLGLTSPKYADVVQDINGDGKVEWLIHSGGGVVLYDEHTTVMSSSQPIDGSIRQYTKTGGIQLEIAQRSKPILFRDWNADGVQDLWWLHGTQALIQLPEQQVTVDLPINVDPRKSTKPKKELTWIRYADVNSDGFTDMVWQYWVRGESWFGSTSEIGFSLSDGTRFLEPHTLKLSKAIIDVRLADLNADGTQELWLLGTDLGVGSLSRTLLTQQATASLMVYELSSGFTKTTFDWSISIPIGQDDAFDYQIIPDITDDGIVDLAVLLADEARMYSSTADSWDMAFSKELDARGNWVVPSKSILSTRMPVWSEGRKSITVLVLQ